MSATEIARKIGKSKSWVLRLLARGDSAESIIDGSYARMRGRTPLDIGENAIGLHVGARVKARRLELGISQAEVTRMTGIWRPNVARLERGYHAPTIEMLALIARALRTTVSALVEGVEAV